MTTFAGSRPVSGGERVASGTVKLIADSGDVVTLIRNGDASRSGSVGGWQQSERELREDADWWKGPQKGSYSVPCLLDSTVLDDIEGRLKTLYAMGKGSDDDDPPGIRIYGVLPMSGGLWKLDDISLGATLEREDAPGKLRRVELTLEMSTLAKSTGVTDVSVRRTRDKTGKRRRRTIITKKGDTVRAIAVRQLGSSGDYKLIREWNPRLKRVDPDAPLRAGVKVVLH